MSFSVFNLTYSTPQYHNLHPHLGYSCLFLALDVTMLCVVYSPSCVAAVCMHSVMQPGMCPQCYPAPSGVACPSYVNTVYSSFLWLVGLGPHASSKNLEYTVSTDEGCAKPDGARTQGGMWLVTSQLRPNEDTKQGMHLSFAQPA